MRIKDFDAYGKQVWFAFVFLIFVPSITFSIISSEIFPWAFIFVILYLKTVSIEDFAIVFVLVFYTFFSILLYGDFSESFRSLIAYLNVFFIFSILSGSSFNAVVKVLIPFKYFFIFVFVFGVFQFIGFMAPIVPLLQLFIPRASADSLSEMGRGITLLSSEPSRAAYEFIFIYALYRFFFIKKYFFFFDLILMVFVFAFLKSAMGVVLLFFFLLLYYRVKFLFFFGVALFSLAPYFIYIDYSSRIYSIFTSVLYENDFGSVFHYLLNVSGFRLLSLYASFSSISEYWFGYGVGSWKESSILALKSTGLNPSDFEYFSRVGNGNWVPIRPTAPFFGLILDFGLTTFLIIFLLFRKMIGFLNYTRDSKSLVALFFVYFFSMGAIGNPVPWIVLAIIISYERGRNEK